MSRTPLEARRSDLVIQAHANGKATTPLHLFREISGASPQFVYSDVINPTASSARAKYRDAAVAALGEDRSADIESMCMELGGRIDQSHTLAGKPTASTGQPAEEETPWPEPVDGAALFDDLCRHKQQYVTLGSHELKALVAWVFHTYVTDVTDYTPYPWPNSPVRGCGKSTLLNLEEHLVYRPQLTSGITAAALARRIDRLQPTMLLDEMDTQLLGERGEALRGILNSGFQRTGKYTVCQGDDNEDRDFRTFCPKMLAGIGRLWDTVESRSIPIRMERANPDELRKLKKLRGDKIREQCAPFRQKLLRWANDTRDSLREAEPDVPDVLDARRADVWRPLLAIGESLSADIAAHLRAAAVAIHRGDAETDYALLLLGDLRDLFTQRRTDVMFTSAIVTALLSRDDRPWPEMKRGDKAITGRDVAKLLGRFITQGDPAKPPRPIAPRTVRIDEETAKGYRLADLQPAFDRYLPRLEGEPNNPSQASHAPDVTAVTANPDTPIGVVEYADGSSELTEDEIQRQFSERRARRMAEAPGPAPGPLPASRPAGASDAARQAGTVPFPVTLTTNA